MKAQESCKYFLDRLMDIMGVFGMFLTFEM